MSNTQKIAVSYLAKPDRSWSKAKVGDKIETLGGMGCFRFSEAEYRCVKQIGNYAVIISSPIVNPMPIQEEIDRECFTILRGFKSPSCGFNATLTIVERGIDHMETTRIYVADTLELTRYSKY